MSAYYMPFMETTMYTEACLSQPNPCMWACHFKGKSKHKLKLKLPDYERARHGVSGLRAVREGPECEYLKVARENGAATGMLVVKGFQWRCFKGFGGYIIWTMNQGRECTKPRWLRCTTSGNTHVIDPMHHGTQNVRSQPKYTRSVSVRCVA